LGFHFGSLVLSNLPWSPVVAPVYPLYGAYVHQTGQAQLWGMYRCPFHYNPVYEIEAEDSAVPSQETPLGQGASGSPRRAASIPTGLTLYPLGMSREWSPRFLYLIEGLFNNEEAARAFLTHVQGNHNCVSLKLIKSTAKAPDFGAAFSNQHGKYG